MDRGPRVNSIGPSTHNEKYPEIQPSGHRDSLKALLELIERREEARRRETRNERTAGENEWKRGKSV